MTKPTSVLFWAPDSQKPHGIWAKWVGAGWHYTLSWGDGTPDMPMAFWDPAARHEYPRAATYTLTAWRMVNGRRVEKSEQVTLRDYLKPPVAAELVEGTTDRVRLNLPAVADPVRFQVAWGDGRLTEHGAADTAPEHTYPSHFTGRPSIVVRDVPARRTATLLGPELTPPATDVDGFFFEFVEATDTYRRFRLRGGGLNPGQVVTWYPWHCSWYRDVTVDPGGHITDTIDIPIPSWPEWDVWRSYTVKHGGDQVTFVPLHAPRAATLEADLTYQVHVDGDPRAVEFTATPAQLGRHGVDFGDGTNTVVDVTTLPLRVRHTYPGGGPYTVTVTLPDGRQATATVTGVHPCPPCFNVNYPGRCAIDWWITGNWCGACGGDSDAYAPVVIDNGVHPVHQLHKTVAGSPWHTGYGYGGFSAGWYTFTYRTALEAPAAHRINITKAAKIKARHPAIEEITLDSPEPPPNPLSHTFHVGNTRSRTRYTATFNITNGGARPVPWQLDFTLVAPAVLAEVTSWVGTASKTNLGGGRWRITCDQPARVQDPFPVEITVDPCGDPRRWPTDVALTVPVPAGIGITDA